MPSIADYQASDQAKHLEAHKQTVREHCMTLDMKNLHALAQYYINYSHSSLLLLEDKVRQRQAWDPILKVAESPERKRYLRNILVEDHVTAYNHIELLRVVIDHIRAQQNVPDSYIVDLGSRHNELAQRGKNAQETIKSFVANLHDLHVA